MGRSASRLSRTRSGVVSPRFLAPGIARLSLPAPVPPLRLLERQPWISRLRHCRHEDVQAADVLRLSGDSAEFLVKLFRIAPRQLRHAVNPQQFKVANNHGTNRNQVVELSCVGWHESSSLTR